MQTSYYSMRLLGSSSCSLPYIYNFSQSRGRLQTKKFDMPLRANLQAYHSLIKERTCEDLFHCQMKIDVLSIVQIQNSNGCAVMLMRRNTYFDQFGFYPLSLCEMSYPVSTSNNLICVQCIPPYEPPYLYLPCDS